MAEPPHIFPGDTVRWDGSPPLLVRAIWFEPGDEYGTILDTWMCVMRDEQTDRYHVWNVEDLELISRPGQTSGV